MLPLNWARGSGSGWITTIRYHEAIENVTPSDKFYGRDRMVLEKSEKVRRETMRRRRELCRLATTESLPNGVT
jgi:hypothetical protein